ncbi:MAG TPA: LysR family transcriptional regulator [Candidatus Faecaligallichristensenella faecipullorum]|nr:LysR family transcriptional regulator [Candidatus Faecaligallichristensenella faecipullorum]
MVDPKIKTLLKLNELGSYTKAAQALSLSQPAVSNHIRILEQEFGIKIFIKGQKKLKPTPAGEVLIRYAHRAVALSAKVRQAIEDQQREVRSLTVGLTPTASDILVPQILATFCNNHPGVHITIVTDTIKNIDKMLQFYELDFAIVDGILNNPNYVSILMDTDYLCLVVSPQHPFAQRQSVNLKELQRENLVLRPKKAGTRKLFEGYLISHGYSIRDFNVMMEVDSVATIKELVALNLGITVISHSACREEELSGRLVVVPIENCRMVREINMIYPRNFEYVDMLNELRQR